MVLGADELRQLLVRSGQNEAAIKDQVYAAAEPEDARAFVDGYHKQYSRYSAFQRELRAMTGVCAITEEIDGTRPDDSADNNGKSLIKPVFNFNSNPVFAKQFYAGMRFAALYRKTPFSSTAKSGNRNETACSGQVNAFWLIIFASAKW